MIVCGLFRSAHRFSPWFRYTLCHLVSTTWFLDEVMRLVHESHRPGLEPVHVEKKCPFKDLWNTATGRKKDICNILCRYRLREISPDFFLPQGTHLAPSTSYDLSGKPVTFHRSMVSPHQGKCAGCLNFWLHIARSGNNLPILLRLFPNV